MSQFNIDSKVNWAERYMSATAGAAYYQRLADHHRKSADEALRMLDSEKNFV